MIERKQRVGGNTWNDRPYDDLIGLNVGPIGRGGIAVADDQLGQRRQGIGEILLELLFSSQLREGKACAAER